MRGDDASRDPNLSQGVHGKKKDASFQVIVLGASGGPREDSVSGLLVRAPQSEWRKGSVIAVDAGVHLASIVRILQQHMPLYSQEKPPPGYTQIISNGPFAGVKCHGYSARANALHIFRELMHAFLITHPHLDHLSGLGVNTPALEYGREAKTIIALDSTIEAIKNHVFNDAIWPNLSDEGSGVGFVTYRRLKEGGNHRLGSGDARGYVRVCDTLATLCMGVTHGKCKPKPPIISPLHRNESAGWHDAYSFPQRRLSRISDHESYFAAVHSHGHGHNQSVSSASMLPQGPPTPGFTSLHTPNLAALDAEHFEPVKSSAFFILNEETTSEVLIFGDIEPDGVSLSPQNYKVWRTAAPKIANGSLKAMFIECSYDDSVRDSDLYGHLCPRHLIQELLFLAKEVAEVKASKMIGQSDMMQVVPDGKRSVDDAAESVAPRKRKKANGLSSTSVETDTPSPSSRSPMIEPTSPYVGTRSAASRRSASISVNSKPGEFSPASLGGQSPSRIPQAARHVHFSGQPRSSSTAVQSLSPQLRPSSYPASGLGLHTSIHVPPLDTSDTSHLERQPDALEGLTVHIIHVKDTLADGPGPGEVIIGQLKEQAKNAGLACNFHVTAFGESIWI